MANREKLMDVLREHGVDVDANEIDLQVSGDSAEALKKLIANGAFEDMPEFKKFLVAAYLKNNLGAAMSGDKTPPESTIRDIIGAHRLDKNFSDADKKKLLALMVIGFVAVRRFLAKRQAARPA
jgi:hypothetical protein